MLRHTAFAIVSLFACGVASAQQPLTPYWNYGGTTTNPSLNCQNGFCGTQAGNYGNGQMICGPNGCYAPGTAPGTVRPSQTNYWPLNRPYGSQYHTLPYTTPSSSYPGFPNIPSARRDRNLPTASGYPLFHMPSAGNWNYHSPVTGSADYYDTYSGPGVLH
jgi:hypothetical protein